LEGLTTADYGEGFKRGGFGVPWPAPFCVPPPSAADALGVVSVERTTAQAAAALTEPAVAPDFLGAAQRVSQAAGSPVDVLVVFASDNTAVQRARQLAKITPFVGDAVPQLVK
jgi:hypothetical protein